jgi:hypothetical protein
MEELAVDLVALPEKGVLAIIKAIADFKRGLVPLNLHWFLNSQIVFKILMMAAMITNLH